MLKIRDLPLRYVDDQVPGVHILREICKWCSISEPLAEADNEMTLRIDYRAIAPDAIATLSQVNDYISNSSIDSTLRYLVEIRTSQINGCSYCIQIHRAQALGIGEDDKRLDALERWRESSLFSNRERVALAWTDNVTLIAESHAPQDVFAALRGHFSDKQIVDLTIVIMSMNSWNRLAISFGRKAQNE